MSHRYDEFTTPKTEFNIKALKNVKKTFFAKLMKK